MKRYSAVCHTDRGSRSADFRELFFKPLHERAGRRNPGGPNGLQNIPLLITGEVGIGKRSTNYVPPVHLIECFSSAAWPRERHRRPQANYLSNVCSPQAAALSSYSRISAI